MNCLNELITNSTRHPEFISGSQGKSYTKSIDRIEPKALEILKQVQDGGAGLG